MDKMTFAKPFGDMLKEKRKLRGLSQMGLAMKSGRSLRCIQYLEAGTQEPTLSTLYAIAHALVNNGGHELLGFHAAEYGKYSVSGASRGLPALWHLLMHEKRPARGLLETACLK